MSKCRFCKKPATSYYDMSIGGLGNFIEHCADHANDAAELGHARELCAPRMTSLDPQADRIAALEAELAAARETLPCGHPKANLLTSAETGEPLYCECCDVRGQRNDLQADLAAAQARIAELEQDAARYRWLRDSVRDVSGAIDDRLYVACDDRRYPGKWALDGSELDAAIDSARGGA